MVQNKTCHRSWDVLGFWSHLFQTSQELQIYLFNFFCTCYRFMNFFSLIIIFLSISVINDALCEQRLWDMKHKGITNFYMCEIQKDFTIDATFKGNASRFLNHSCDPNCNLEKWLVLRASQLFDSENDFFFFLIQTKL